MLCQLNAVYLPENPIGIVSLYHISGDIAIVDLFLFGLRSLGLRCVGSIGLCGVAGVAVVCSACTCAIGCVVSVSLS